jgi:hypothetical protein
VLDQGGAAEGVDSKAAGRPRVAGRHGRQPLSRLLALHRTCWAGTRRQEFPFHRASSGRPAPVEPAAHTCRAETLFRPQSASQDNRYASWQHLSSGEPGAPGHRRGGEYPADRRRRRS